MSIKYLILLVIIFVIINSDVFYAIIGDIDLPVMLMKGTVLVGGFAVGGYMIEQNLI